MNRKQRRMENKQGRPVMPGASAAAHGVFAEAVRQHQSGRLNEAERLYRQVLAVDPRHADSLHLLGVVAHQAGDHGSAVELISQAIKINAKAPPYHSSLGIVLAHQGQLDQAIAAYRIAISLNPDYPEAHNNLGIALGRQGRLDHAVACYQRAIGLRPDYPEAHNNLGAALKDQGRLDEAIACYQRALALRPDYPEAHNNLGAAFRDQGRLNDAVASGRRALAIRPGYPEAHNNLGKALREQGHLKEAAACYRKALDLRPGYPEAHNNLGIALKDQGRMEEAVACYRRALDHKPDYPEADNNLGIALAQLGLLDEAVACYRRALDRKPKLLEAHNNLGAALRDLGRLDEAVTCFQTVLDIEPAYPEAHNNMGAALTEQGRLDEAIACYRGALDRRPDYPEAYNNLAIAVKQQGRLDDAIACYRKALDIKPDWPEAHCGLGMALLSQGDMAAGWAEYEWRWKTALLLKGRRTFAQPQWRGEAAEGRTLLVYAEQGFGDTLQFCRYAPLAAARGLRVILLVPKPLVRLLRSLPEVNLVLGEDEDLPPFDLHCPMLSMPLALGTTLTTIPSAESYLHADASQVAAWRTRLDAMGERDLRIGLVWAGNPRSHAPALAAVDRRRSMAPDRLAPLFDLPGLQFFSLQKDGPAAPAHVPLIDFMAEMKDFADTAALIANLDLVISVDTAVVHLAAALGTPVWMLDRYDPCWRWLLGRRDSPWYPTLRLYRQPQPGDWDSVLAEVVRDLRGLIDENESLTCGDESTDSGESSSAAAQAMFADAFEHHRAGRVSEAERLYRQVLAIDSCHADSLHLLGVIANQAGRHDEAIDLISQAIAINARTAPYHSSLGIALAVGGRLDEAAAAYRTALDLNPAYLEAHHNLGITLRRQGRLDEAVACYRKTLALRPDHPEALNNLGAALKAQGQLDEAAACYRRVLAIRPDHPEAHNNLGAALRDLGRLDEAVASYRRALDRKPDYPEALNNLGIALADQERLDEAIACYRRAIDLQPSLLEAHNNLGAAFKEQGRLDEAIACLRGVLQLKPDYPDARNNLGNALKDQGRLDEAVTCYRSALGISPNCPETHINLGNTLRDQKRLDEAVACYHRALDLKPDWPEAHCSLGMALLSRGDMAAGWEEYEWRWKTALLLKCRHGFAQPQWRGEPAAGRTLLVHAEQGFGDTLQFCRYAPLAAAQGMRVILEVPKPLVRLLRSLPGIDLVIGQGEDLPPFDLHCPMLSMPLALRTTLATIPSAEAYLHADPAQIASWRARLDAMGDHGPRIGLVWAGNPRSHAPALAAVDRRRSMAPDRLAPLFDLPGLQFFSLQKDGPAAPAHFPLIDFMAEMGDFADTAALIANLDLVISVDTAVVHLAAALGTPVWMLDRFDPCWRWLLGRRDSPWYPTLRLYRQPQPGDWDPVLAEIVRDLRGFAPASEKPAA